MSELLAFYRGTGCDHRGRTLDDILAFSDAELEATHDYIQWLFPSDQASAFNAQAPVIGVAEIDAFQASPKLQRRLGQSLDRMLAFYGFLRRLNGGEAFITEAANAAIQQRNWLQPGNHNHLRLTRMLRCCTLLGLKPDARALLMALDELAAQHPHAITPETERFWRQALDS
jgi:hypothetical protein